MSLIVASYSCQKDSTPPTPAPTSTTSTSAASTTSSGIPNNSMKYDNIAITDVTGFCEFAGEEITVVAQGTAGDREYVLFVSFFGSSPKSGIYKCVAPKGVLVEGTCSAQLSRRFSGTEQNLYPKTGTEIELIASGQSNKVSILPTKFIAIGSTFNAIFSTHKVGCN